jgi:hypothetical protein
MDKLMTLTVVALGSALLSGCGTHQDESAAQTGPASPAVEAPVDEMAPAQTESLPSDEADPAMSDSLPTTDKPPPPPPG